MMMPSTRRSSVKTRNRLRKGTCVERRRRSEAVESAGASGPACNKWCQAARAAHERARDRETGRAGSVAARSHELPLASRGEAHAPSATDACSRAHSGGARRREPASKGAPPTAWDGHAGAPRQARRDQGAHLHACREHRRRLHALQHRRRRHGVASGSGARLDTVGVSASSASLAPALWFATKALVKSVELPHPQPRTERSVSSERWEKFKLDVDSQQCAG